MKISIIMPSYLGDYKTAAKNRDEKIIRAVESAHYQDYDDFEIILVSHGCQETLKIARHKLSKIERLRVIHILRDENDLWSGQPRNAGIFRAVGDVICYLDIDDMLEPGHLTFIANNFKHDWIWFNDNRVDKTEFKKGNVLFNENFCDVNKKYFCGTSNIAHKKGLAWWPACNEYAGDDWGFIERLKKFNYSFAGRGGYLVCHIPKHNGFYYDI